MWVRKCLAEVELMADKISCFFYQSSFVTAPTALPDRSLGQAERSPREKVEKKESSAEGATAAPFPPSTPSASKIIF